MLSGGTQRRVLPRCQSEEMKIYVSFPRVGSKPTTSRFYRHTLYPCATTGLTAGFIFLLDLNTVLMQAFLKNLPILPVTPTYGRSASCLFTGIF